MGMDHRCLVLSGRLLDGQEPAVVHERMAAAFGMEMAGFRERVFSRAPLIIRRGLDAGTAEAQAAQLRGMGVEADVWPDGDTLIWLRRDNQVRGPLPEAALDRYAEPGDQWCHDGGESWFAWTPSAATAELPAVEPADVHTPLETLDVADANTAFEREPDAHMPATEPPPLPAHHASAKPVASPAHEDAFERALEEDAAPSSEPPPLPPSMPAAPSATAKRPFSTAAVFSLLFAALALFWHPLAPIALLVAACALAYLYPRPVLRGRAVAVVALALSATALFLWMHRPAPTPVAEHYVPRPLKPLKQSAPGTVAATQCVAHTATPKNDEDRFLLTGERLLTGRAQRKGDTYVAEAAVSVDKQCQPNALQLYVFHNGVFIGTALDTAASEVNTRLTDFDLIDDQHLRVTLAQCTDQPASCAATTVRQFAVTPGGGGWTLGEMK